MNAPATRSFRHGPTVVVCEHDFSIFAHQLVYIQVQNITQIRTDSAQEASAIEDGEIIRYESTRARFMPTEILSQS